MSNFPKSLALFASAFVVLVASSAAAQSFQLEVDQTQPLRFERPVTGVVVGNASIADVIVHDARVLFVIGKSTGTTEITAVDAAGRTVFSGTVQVRPANVRDMVTIQRGREISTAICQERCIPNVHSEGTTQGNNPAVTAINQRSGFAAGSGSRQ
ncbi:pilus assembly protein N-terminal domain-containing protein [Aquidulcibacter sp.]|uniref:pilus assembly protein N-terminal domain-containing protein n=1 Tax=Aquidulcibacter sp. TaxID=2052990 RepID=UPI0025BEBDA6|nr:pilus assembly protein N-terminal domain-containing protein [Aquidulcibacter sp.]MCA3693365.1 pilus assembly protein N-terminal domain-containing protein [Aquidulcibacter sp.]